ncbi:oxidoreductase-like domain-containing protein 1 [Aphomia sociella]
MLRSKLVSVKPLMQYQYKQGRLCTCPPSATDEEKERELERIARDASIEEPPTACCQSGCSNCVFIAWAEALTTKMDNAGPEIAEKILKLVEDPSMKAYLEMELRLRGLKK